MTAYDVIGDVHGHADALIGLLRKLGYMERDGAWRHPDRQAIFVGDLIDRGPQQLETIDIVRRMVDAGSAQIVLGNHEFNAVAYATPTETGGYLRPREPRNDRQHAAFIAAVGLDSPLHREIIDWFMTIPLWLELDGLRVIHACWSEPDLTYVREHVSPTNTLTSELVVNSSTEGHPAFLSVETLLKGPEAQLPHNMSFLDKGNHERHHVRMKWWDETATHWRDLLSPGTTIFDTNRNHIDKLPDEPIPDTISHRYTDDTPVIFGHYWFEAPLELNNPRALCIDYSACAGGPLAAYRFHGEPTLTADNLISFGPATPFDRPSSTATTSAGASRGTAGR